MDPIVTVHTVLSPSSHCSHCQGSLKVQELEQFKPVLRGQIETVQLMDVYYDASGKRRTKGNPNLKKSQAYPIQLLVSNCIKTF